MQEGLLEGREKGLLEGREKGLLEGREEGLLEGKQEGFNDSMLHSIQNVMESLNITVEQAMEILKVPTDRRQFFSQAILKQLYS